MLFGAILTHLIPLQVENESLIGDAGDGEQIGSDVGLFEDPGRWLFEGLFGDLLTALEDMSRQLMEVAFGVTYVNTEGPLSFGEPTGGVIDIFSSGLLPYLANEIYDYVWLMEGGSMTALGIIILVAGIGIRGLFDMTNYAPNRGTEDHSYVSGFIWIIFWYPIFLGLINTVHAGIITFSSDAGIGYGLSTAVPVTVAQAALLPIAGWIVIAIGILPYLILGAIMLIRTAFLAVYLFFGPVLIGGKHSNLPIVSRACKQILDKSVSIVLIPAPIAPLMFIFGNFILSGPIASVAPLAGSILLGVIGWTLLIAVWMTFKIVSPQLAGAGGTLSSIAAAGVTIATGGGGAAAASAMRGGPAAAAARWAGNKWGGDDGSR